ncbi:MULTISPECIES: hypothetical protein [Nocardia]|jgi:hypothetical protein|uniref:hypothetical protein n=1 Tax=Nocardia TaxID=1817 RepID=UPI0013006276|nr:MULTISPECIES: hypothetical protein [Nocardia]
MRMGPQEECGSGVDVPDATERCPMPGRDVDSILKAGIELALVLVDAAAAAEIAL